MGARVRDNQRMVKGVAVAAVPCHVLASPWGRRQSDSSSVREEPHISAFAEDPIGGCRRAFASTVLPQSSMSLS
jgi:hypothetical protein